MSREATITAMVLIESSKAYFELQQNLNTCSFRLIQMNKQQVKERRLPVTFNARELKLYDELHVTQPFSKFVKDAFYDKVDALLYSKKKVKT